MRIAVLIKVEHESHDAARTCEQELLSNCNGCAKNLWKRLVENSLQEKLPTHAVASGSAVFCRVGCPFKGNGWLAYEALLGRTRALCRHQNLYILFCLAFWKTISTGKTYSGQCCRHLMGQRACRIHGTKLKRFRRLLEH